MADCRLGLLLLLLPTAHPGRSKAQHWSQGWYPRGKRASSSAQHSQHVPRLPASRPDKAAHNLPSDALAPPENSVPWEARTTGWWSLHRKQRLVQTLLVSTERGPGIGHQGPLWPRTWAMWTEEGVMRKHRDAPCQSTLRHTARCHLLFFLFPRILGTIYDKILMLK
ncbi:progonadoliberin-2 [Lynx canadensis]|uniref:Progonadoliberin-2 n=1 Tax=Lynx canadensis TaxID=61383 RepID=A0A667IHQ8_LYNCA|nr:progonadoliberin-2 [Lynx canadensis]